MNDAGASKAAELRQQIETAPDARTRVQSMLRLTDELQYFDPAEAEEWTRRAIEEAREADLPDLLSMAQAILAWRLRELGRLDESERICDEALAVARPAGARRSEAAICNVLGDICMARTRHEQAIDWFERCLKISREIDYEGGVSTALSNLLLAYLPTGQIDRCIDYVQQALVLERKRADWGAVVVSLGNLGLCYAELGDWERAYENCYRGLAMAEEYGLKTAGDSILSALAVMYQKRGKLERALALHRQVVEQAREQGNPDHLAHSCSTLADACLDNGDPLGAQAAIDEARPLAETLGDQSELARDHRIQAAIDLASGRPDDALPELATALAIAERHSLLSEQGICERVRGETLVAIGRPDDARQAFERSIAALKVGARTSLGSVCSHELARASLTFARFLKTLGDLAGTRFHAEQAADAFRMMGVLRGLEAANRLLLELDSGPDRTIGLIRGLSELATLSAPISDIATALLTLLTRSLRFRSAALLLFGRSSFQVGRISLPGLQQLAPGREVLVEPDSVHIPIRMQQRTIGALHLQEPDSEAKLPEPAFWELIADILVMIADRARRLQAQLPPVAGQALPGGLRLDHEAGTTPLRFGTMVALSPVMQTLLATVERVAPTTASVLIRGETGTGKDLVARAIHALSPRARAAFVAINCAALPETLLEEELFGIEKGVATGVQARVGRLQQADGGTVFLDEIGDMSPGLQAKLLRSIQERVVEPVGSRREVPIDIRFVSATSRNLEQAVEDGSFRADLYHRLNVIPLWLPPLRERKEEIPGLVEHFVRKHSEEFLRPVQAMTAEALELLLNHDWPGNVRELEHAVESAVILARDGIIMPENLPKVVRTGKLAGAEPTLRDLRDAQDVVRKQVTASLEQEQIRGALRKHDGNVPAAAAELGLSRSHLYRLMKKLGIDPKQP